MNRRGANLTGPLGGSGMVGRWGASSLIKSIQRGTIVLANVASNTATIASVDLANTTLSWLSSNYNGGADVSQQNYCGRVSLTNATTVTAERQFNANSLTVSYEVVEWNPGVLKSIQRGSITISHTASSNTATVTGVETAKSYLVFGGIQSQPNTGYGIDSTGKLVLTNGTTVTFDRSGTNNSLVAAYHLVEWF